MVTGYPQLQRGLSGRSPLNEGREPSIIVSGKSEEKINDELGENGTDRIEESELSFPDGGLRVSLPGDACGHPPLTPGMASSRWGVLDRVLRVRDRSRCRCFPNAVSHDVPGRLLGEPNLMDHFVGQAFAAEAGLTPRTQAFFTFGLACFTGALFDKYGHKPLIAAGTFFLVLGFCMLSLCTRYYQLFLVHATLLAWGCNLLYVGGNASSSRLTLQVHLPHGGTWAMV